MSTEWLDSTPSATAAGAPVFPVVWDDPRDAANSWRLDRMHWPAPISVMTDEMLHIVMEHGFNAALRSLGVPIRNYVRRINTFHYDAMLPAAGELEAPDHTSADMLTDA